MHPSKPKDFTSETADSISSIDKVYVKTFAKEIIDGSYLNANSEEKYKELESKYMNLAE